MKTTVILVIFLIFAGFGKTTAQAHKGTFLVGISSTLSPQRISTDLVNIGFTSIKYKSDVPGLEDNDASKQTLINLTPKIGYFATENFLIGLDMSTLFFKEKAAISGYTTNMSLIGTGPFLRLYTPGDKTKLFVEFNSYLGTVKTKYHSEYYEGEESSHVSSLGGGVGIAAPLGERVTFDVMAGYNSMTVKDKEDNPNNNKTIFGTFGIKLGFSVKLGKVKNQN